MSQTPADECFNVQKAIVKNSKLVRPWEGKNVSDGQVIKEKERADEVSGTVAQHHCAKERSFNENLTHRCYVKNDIFNGGNSDGSENNLSAGGFSYPSNELAGSSCISMKQQQQHQHQNFQFHNFNSFFYLRSQLQQEALQRHQLEQPPSCGMNLNEQIK